jgi:predicted DNA-binding transcriptional regulator YafY
VDPSTRLLRLLSLLQARPTWTSAELEERLGVGERTVRRDVTRLRDLGYPVHTNPGEAGYTLGAGGRLPPLLLDDDEAVAIAVGLRLAAMSAVGGAESAAIAALAKLEQVLPAHVRERVRSIESSTLHLGAAMNDLVQPETLVALAMACRRNERVRAAYRDYNGLDTERRLEPLQIVHKGRRWYLVAWDCDRRDWRTFRVDRLTNVELTGHNFEHHDPPDAATFVIEGTTVAAWPIEARIRVDMTFAEAKSLFEPYAGVVEALSDGQAIVRIGSNDVQQLARFATGLSCEWEVLEPASVRAEVRRVARSVLRRHPASPG